MPVYVSTSCLADASSVFDVLETYADVEDLSRVTGFRPDTDINDGIKAFVSWYVDYYKTDR